MEIFGIKFAPLIVPMKRRMQTLAAAIWFLIVAGGGAICSIFTIYLLLHTHWRWLTILYLFWIWVVEKDISHTGGRRSKWVRGWILWEYFRDYFPARLEKVPWVELDPKKNYLFCSFPHGLFSAGIFSTFGTHAGDFHNLFPFHTPYAITLKQNFNIPFFREIILGLGGCDPSAESISWLLGAPSGGNVVILMVGGAAEAFHCKPGKYRFVVKNRRGFVRLALKTGASLVPVISFGETDLFDQVSSPEGSIMRKFQEYFKKVAGWVPIIPIGRGFFQYSFGLIPRRHPVTTLVGRPIGVEKNLNPRNEEINELHARFLKELIQLFEEQKHLYIKDNEDIKLEIE